jgi:CRP-like cAMP-binding protein
MSAVAFARSLSFTLPPLAELEGRHLDEALAAFIPCEVGPGEVLMDPDDAGYPAAMVVSGEVHVTTSAQPWITVARLGPGDLIGGSPLHPGSHRPPSRVVSQTPCQLLVLEDEGAAWLGARNHPVLDALQRLAVSTYAARLRELARATAELGRLPDGPVAARPSSLLSRLTSTLGRPRRGPPSPQEVFARSRVFKDLPPHSREWLAARMDPVPLPKHRLVQVERSPTTGVYLVASGQVSLSRDYAEEVPAVVGALGPGGLLGLTGLVDRGRAELSCEATEPTWLYRLQDDAVAEILGSREGLAVREAVLVALYEQLRQASLGLTELSVQVRRRGGVQDDRMFKATLTALWSH